MRTNPAHTAAASSAIRAAPHRARVAVFAGKQLLHKFGELIPNLKSRKEPKPKQPELDALGMSAGVGPSGSQPAPTINKQTSSKKKHKR